MRDKSNLYIGRAGQLLVMSEFLLRGWNAALPEVDVGDDVFVVKDEDGTLFRIQVKTAGEKEPFSHPGASSTWEGGTGRNGGSTLAGTSPFFPSNRSGKFIAVAGWLVAGPLQELARFGQVGMRSAFAEKFLRAQGGNFLRHRQIDQLIEGHSLTLRGFASLLL